MKPLNKLFVLVGLISSFAVNAQVGIGTTTPEGALDISSANGGLVIPRANLLSINDVTTVANPQGGNPARGTVIYDMGANIQEGFYYYNGTVWMDLLSTDDDDYLAKSDQALMAERTIDASSYDLIIDAADDGSTALQIEAVDILRLSRDPGSTPSAIISSRNNMNFSVDSNENTIGVDAFAWGENASVADGTGDSDYQEYMRLHETGLGIGIDPEYALHVMTGANRNIAKLESPDFPIFGGFIIEDTAGNNTSKFVISPGNIANNSGGAMSGVPSSNSNARNSVTFDMEGSTYDIYTFMEGQIRPGFDNLTTLGAPNHRFTDLYLVNNPTVTSDIRLKENIEETQYGLDTVMQITPVSYELISDANDEVHLGFKAQEIQELIPEVVNTAPESGMLSMAYAEMIPVLTKAIQELNDKVDNLIRENENLRAQNTTLANGQERE